VRVVLDQLNPVATLRAEDGHGSSAC
jgi:hypothetical protein